MSHKSTCIEKSNKKVQTVKEIGTELKDVIEFMQIHYVSADPDFNILKKCMAATFDYRRHFITWNSPEVVEIQNNYPALFNFSEIKREFKRITTMKVFENFSKGLERCHEPVLKRAHRSREKTLVESQLQLYKNDREHLQYVKTAGTVLLLPSLFEVNLHHFIIFNDQVPDSTSTKIVCSSSLENCLAKNSRFEVCVEKLRVCDTNDLRSAFFALCAAYYVFNMAYPEPCVDMMTIVEKVFLNITPEVMKISERVKHVEGLLTGSHSS